jgi:hypothetical protein
METLEILSDRQAVADIHEAGQQMAQARHARKAGAGGAARAPSVSAARYTVLLSPAAKRARTNETYP